MLGKPEPNQPSPSGDPANAGLFHEIEALSLEPKPRRRPPSPHARHLYFSSAAARSHLLDSSLKPSSSSSLLPRSASLKGNKLSASSSSSFSTSSSSSSSSSSFSTSSSSASSSSSSSSSSIWSWRPLRALSHIRHHRFDCRFSLHVHSIQGLPPPLANAALCVHWRRTTDAAVALTGTVRAVHGTAEFGETLTYRCSVYGSRSGPQHSAKYEARHFFLYATVVVAPGVDLGKHRVDLTGLLPLTLEELEKKSSGEWSTSFRG